MSTCNRLDLGTLGYWLVTPKNLPRHWVDPDSRVPQRLTLEVQKFRYGSNLGKLHMLNVQEVKHYLLPLVRSICSSKNFPTCSLEFCNKLCNVLFDL